MGTEVIVAKENDNLYCYLNVCPHRFSPLIDEAINICSKKTLTCKYHGWTFNLDGSVKKIPFNSKLYNKNLKNLSLKRISIDCIGKFIFINFNNSKKKISNQFSKNIINNLKNISDHITDYSLISQNKKFNWKLIIENLRDPLHPLFLHSKTLLKSVNCEIPSVPRWLPVFFLPMKYISFGGPDSKIKKANYENNFTYRWDAKNRYHNYHLFPNFHLACADNGCTFVLENYVPLDEEVTKIEIFYLYTKHNMDKESFIDFKEKLFKTSMEVYIEDFNILENIQKNISESQSMLPGNGKYERLILRFHGVYIRAIGLTKYLIERTKIFFSTNV